MFPSLTKLGQVKREQSKDVQTLSLEGQETFENDLFGSVLDQYEQEGKQEPLRVDRDVLLSLKKTEVFMRQWDSTAIRTQYFKLMVPSIAVVMCTSCNHFFHEDDYEIASIQKRRCPVCRYSSDHTL
jgi:hypothetical protein